MTHITISGLYHYPIKSLAGIAVQNAVLTPFGMQNDRRWMIVDSKGHFVTQRLFPSLSKIRLSIDKDYIHLSADNMPEQLLPISLNSGERKEVQIWHDVVEAIPANQVANQWISNFLGKPCEFVYMPESTQRKVDPDFSRHADDQVSFADGYQYLLISEDSLANLNEKLQDKGETTVPMSRFRPNIVIQGCAPYAEDDWKQFNIGENHFHIVKPCSRCIMTTVDASTGEKGIEPLKTLMEYRKRGNQAYFGQNVILDLEHKGNMRLSVNDPLQSIN